MSISPSHLDAPPDATGAGEGTDDDVGSDTAATFLAEHPDLERLGRAGWIAKGVVYLLTGVLAAVVVATALGRTGGGGDEDASQSGAIAEIADRPYGGPLLVVLALGLVLYAMWRVLTIILPADNDAHAWLTRIGYGVSAITYLTLSWSALSIVRGGRGNGGRSEDAKVEDLTRSVMSHGGGRWLVGAIGAGLIVIGIGFAVKRAWQADFTSSLTAGGVGPVSHHAIVVLGRIGWIGRALMMGLIGTFLVRAAWTFDPDDAKGLDGSLRQATDMAVGRVLVVVLAAGLIAFGVFCIVSAPRRKLIPADR